MKKSVLVFAAATVATVVVACGSIVDAITGAVKMDTPEATQMVIESLKKNINFDEWKIHEISWIEGEKLSNNISLMHVRMVNKNNDFFQQTFMLDGYSKDNVGDLKKDNVGMAPIVDFATFEGITLEMINPEVIQKQYQEAKAMIPAEYEFRSISHYGLKLTLPCANELKFEPNKKYGELKQEFEINTIEIGKEYVESAGKTSLQYYEFDFKIAQDGSVEPD